MMQLHPANTGLLLGVLAILPLAGCADGTVPTTAIGKRSNALASSITVAPTRCNDVLVPSSEKKTQKKKAGKCPAVVVRVAPASYRSKQQFYLSAVQKLKKGKWASLSANARQTAQAELKRKILGH